MALFGTDSFGFQPFGGQPEKLKVFVSYHHDNDQRYYDRFSYLFHGSYDVITDRSVDRQIRSDDTEYQMRRIREDFITGTSVTVVLCGAETYKRKFVDWEICATLNKKHGLVGINLPTNPINPKGQYVVPDRLYKNIQSRYAVWIQWSEDPNVITQAVNEAKKNSIYYTSLIKNDASTMGRNL